ncbi:hypothetical protein HZY62_16435 [Maribacter polysiphoniae]|nr:hypothetical protein [Maribacter polysiphoniae]MBD1262190.1 hypothetical protein [Maribacter polysiphoniae]
MIHKLYVLITFLLFLTALVSAQELSTTGTKVVIVIDSKTNGIERIGLFGDFEKMDRKKILDTYPNKKFYMGLLKGTYRRHDNTIVLLNDTVVTIYTHKQMFVEDEFPMEEWSIANPQIMGEAKAKVLSSKKGQIIIKIEGN